MIDCLDFAPELNFIIMQNYDYAIIGRNNIPIRMSTTDVDKQHLFYNSLDFLTTKEPLIYVDHPYYVYGALSMTGVKYMIICKRNDGEKLMPTELVVEYLTELYEMYRLSKLNIFSYDE